MDDETREADESERGEAEQGDEQPDGTEPEPDDDDSQADEQAPERPAPSGLSETQLEKRRTDAEKVGRRAATSLERIYAEEWEHFLPCPLCPPTSPGFVYVGDFGHYPPEVIAAVGQVLHGIAQVEYEADPGSHECPTCRGLGEVRTGSRVPGNELRKCAPCMGFGYVPPPAASPNGATAPADFHAPVGEHHEPVAQTDTDDWGEPRTLPDGRANPNYGKLPHHKVPVEPYGITANLTARAQEV